MAIFLSCLQHSGETLEQRKYIESSHLFFLAWGEYGVHLIEDKRAHLKMVTVNLVLSTDIIFKHRYEDKWPQ